MADNRLFYGDNLSILREYVADESVDLVYLDPPFKSDQDYNVLFAEKNGRGSAAQIRAFEDTWQWDQTAARAFQEVVEAGGQVSRAMQAFRTLMGFNDMLAYLAMMAPHLVELHRVLKPTGGLYLHCDTTASHYLKLLLDAVFGPVNFRNEIIWKRAQPKSHAKKRFSRAHDVILVYAKTDQTFFRTQYKEHDPKYVAKFYRFVEEETGRRYRLDNLSNPSKKRPNLTYEFPPGSGVVRVWRWTKERMMKAWEEGLIVIPEKGAVACLKRYLAEMPGTPVTDIWDDIEHLHGSSRESLGYPTQKPEALLERIIEAGSDVGQVVLDPFCGCGTAVVAAQKLNRRWMGIDITPLAVALVKSRLLDTFGPEAAYEVTGEPVSLPDAATLAAEDPFHFQCWALGLVGARPPEIKKGADRGIDGRLYFHDDPRGPTRQIVFSVKSGRVGVKDIRDLRGVLERERAQIA
ncbi:MAG: DNA methyltransferase, partial [Thermodesulfobacteriota bacterium]